MIMRIVVTVTMMHMMFAADMRQVYQNKCREAASWRRAGVQA